MLKTMLNSTRCPVEKNKIQSKLKEAEEKVTNLMADKSAKVVESIYLNLIQ